MAEKKTLSAAEKKTIAIGIHDHQHDIDTAIVRLRAAFNPNSHLANDQLHLIQPCMCPTLSTLRTFYIWFSSLIHFMCLLWFK